MGGNTAAERNDGKITKIGCLQAVGYFFGKDEIRILETQESRQAVGGLSVHVRVLSLLRTSMYISWCRLGKCCQTHSAIGYQQQTTLDH